MLPKRSQEVANCYEHAEECSRKAERASNEEMRQDFIRLQQNLLNLAHSYELAERLLGFSQNPRRRAEFFDDGKSIN
jgi:hypothetical protein